MASTSTTSPNSEFKQADVAAAISRFLGAPSSSPAVAAIASRINIKGIQLAPGSDLAQSGDFQSRILAVGGTELAQITDPNRLAQLLQEQAQRANVTSAEGARLAQGLFNLNGLRGNSAGQGDGVERGSGNDGSSLKYADMKLTPAQLDAQALAKRTPGMEWAANNYDLLRIPGAIQSFIDAKIREESYKAVKSAGFTDHNAVAAAKWAVENKKNGNDVFNNMAESVRVFGGNDPVAQQRWRDLFNKLHTDKTGKAREEMNEALKAEEKHNDPNRRERAKKTRDIYKLEEGAKKEADAKAQQVIANKADVVAGLGDLNAPMPPGPAPANPNATGTAPSTPMPPKGAETIQPTQSKAPVSSAPKP